MLEFLTNQVTQVSLAVCTYCCLAEHFRAARSDPLSSMLSVADPDINCFVSSKHVACMYQYACAVLAHPHHLTSFVFSSVNRFAAHEEQDEFSANQQMHATKARDFDVRGGSQTHDYMTFGER